MAAQRQFEQSLEELRQLLLKMGERVELSIDKAVKSLAKQDSKLARDVLAQDNLIDQMEVEIGDLVAKLIATQQPVAKDMRKLISAIKIASDLERMADLASNIAQVTVELEQSNQRLFKELKDIPDMAQLTQQMVHDGINSYITGNIELAKQLARTDDQVDQLYSDLIQELTSYLPKIGYTEVALHLCFVARYLERIADHATNIAENIVYIETGKRADLN